MLPSSTFVPACVRPIHLTSGGTACSSRTSQPVGDSLALSALCAAVPLITLFVLLGGLRLKAWLAGLISLVVALVVAVVLFGMPVGQALLAATEGAAFGFFPILWIVINAIWVYNLTVVSGHFDVLRRSFEKVSPDQRIQAIIIAFCFGALLEALAGFGTPVAITVVMLMALGFRPIKAAAVALIANTAPVAFGALATPIVTLATVASGVSNDPAADGRQPRRDGRSADPDAGRGRPADPGLRRRRAPRRQGRPGCRPSSAVSRSVSRSSSRPTTSRCRWPTSSPPWSPRPPSCCCCGCGPRPRCSPPSQAGAEEDEVESRRAQARSGRRRRRASSTRDRSTGRAGPGTATDEVPHDSGADMAKAYAPYLVIIAIFSIVNIPAVKDFLAEEPWTYVFAWPGLDVLNAAGDPVRRPTFKFNWLPAAGTLMIFAGIITALILKVSPAEAAQDLRRDLRRAEVGDHHRDGGARAGLRDEPVRPDRLARRLAGRRRRGVRDPLADPRLDRRRGDRLGHVGERAVRRAAGADAPRTPGSTRC